MPCCGLSRERFLRISLKFDSIGYMPYLRQILTSKPQKSSRDTSPYRFTLKFEVKFTNLTSNFTHRGLHLENANFKFATLCFSKAVSSPLTCSGDSGGFCVAALAAASRRGGSAFSSSQRECVLTVANEVQLSTRRVHSTTQRKRALYFASLVAANRP